ncbi:MAG: gamma-glutamyl-gamma-aminobutyrate hydrolase family protein [Acidimicrobiales bacterium]
MTGQVREVSYENWYRRVTMAPSAYLDMIEAAGAAPVLVESRSALAADEIAERVDALVLTGGHDVDPALYGAQPHPRTEAGDPRRDAFEPALLRACMAAGRPVLAICRGIQVLNVARGGTLHQHLPEVVGHNGHQPVAGGYGTHRVAVGAGTRLAAALGNLDADVPTHHHQAIDRVGTGLTPCAWAEDGTIEAVEDLSVPFLIGVQWHPEVGDDRALFDALVGAACAMQPGS